MELFVVPIEALAPPPPPTPPRLPPGVTGAAAPPANRGRTISQGRRTNHHASKFPYDVAEFLAAEEEEEAPPPPAPVLGLLALGGAIVPST